MSFLPPLELPRPRKPAFPARLADAAERAARLLAREALVNPDKEGIEDLIGLALWLESLSTWRKYKAEEDRRRQAAKKNRGAGTETVPARI